MTLDEWRPIAAAMVRRWPNVDWARRAEGQVLDQMFTDLADLDAAHVGAALDGLGRDGGDFPPNAGQIRTNALAMALDVPEWGEVCRIITRAARAVIAPDSATWQQQRQRALDGMHPLVRGFMEQVGWTEGCQAGSPDRTAQAQVREKWLAYARQAERDVRYAGLDTAGLPGLERANARAPRLLGEALRALLPGGPS